MFCLFLYTKECYLPLLAGCTEKTVSQRLCDGQGSAPVPVPWLWKDWLGLSNQKGRLDALHFAHRQKPGSSCLIACVPTERSASE